jgi:WD40 repeat protein
MPWPLSQDYNEAVQSPRHCFTDPELQEGQAVTNALGLPMPRSGNFADVYEVICPRSKTRWAVKCFTREVPGLRERYSEISSHLRQAKLPFTVDFTYLADGIKVQGKWYPILKMQWVEGQLLNECVRNNLTRAATLDGLGQIWARMARRLREANVAHCDLQHGNVILVPGSKAGTLAVKLIDYDGMFVPALAKSRSGEVGHPAFQHPQRLKDGTYNLEVDRFPLLAVASAFHCLKVSGKPLWERFDNGDNLLFREADFRNPTGSVLLKELWQLDDPVAHALVGYLTLATQGRLEQTPLVDQLLEEGTTPALTPAQEKQASSLLGERRPRSSVAVTATAPAQVAVPVVAPASHFDFGAGETGANPFRKKSSGVPAWAWAAGGVGVAAVVAVALFFALRKSPEAAKTEPVVARKEVVSEPAKTPEPKKPSTDEKTTTPAINKVDEKNDKETEPAKPPPAGNGDAQPPKVDPPVEALPLKPNIAHKVAGRSQVSWNTAFAPDCRRALSDDGIEAMLWEVASGRELARFPKHDHLIGLVAVSADGRRALTGSKDKTARVWDVDTGKELRRFGEFPTSVESGAISADGRRVLVSGGDLKIVNKQIVRVNNRLAYADVFVRVFDVDTGVEKCRLEDADMGFTRAVFTPDGQRVVTSSTDGTLRVWDANSGKELERTATLPREINALALAPDGRMALVASNSELSLWNLQTRTEVRRFDGKMIGIRALAFSLDGQRALAGGGGSQGGQPVDTEVRCYDVQSGRELGRSPPHPDSLTAVAFTPDGRTVLSVDRARNVRSWDVSGLQVAAKPVPANEDSLGAVRKYAGHRSPVRSVAVSPDGKRVLTGSVRGELFLWDADSGAIVKQLEGHQSTVESVAFSPDGRYAASAASMNTDTVRLWDLQTLSSVRQFPIQVTRSIAFSRNGGWLAAGGATQQFGAWDLKTGVGHLYKEGGQLRVPQIWGVAFLADNRRVLMGCPDKTLRIWEITTTNMKETARWQTGHTAPVSCIAVSPDGKKALSGSHDGTVKVWNLQNNRLLHTVAVSPQIHSLAFTPDGHRALVGGVMAQNPALRIIDVDGGTAGQTFADTGNVIEGLAVSSDGRHAFLASMDPTLRRLTFALGPKPAAPGPATPMTSAPAPPSAPSMNTEPVPEPDANELEAADSEIKELFKDDYAKKKPADQLALADRLFQRGMKATTKPAERYVCLREARDLATSAFDLQMALRAIDEMAKVFTIEALEMKIEVLDKALRSATRIPSYRLVADSALTLLDQLQTADDYDSVAPLVKVAQTAATGAENAALRSTVQRTATRLERLGKEYEELKNAVATLKTKPQDEEANLSLGKFYCFSKGEWTRGLPMLAQGGDSNLRDLAKKDLATPDADTDRVALADAWWNEAERVSQKNQLLRRSFYWYEKAAPGLSGDTLTRVLTRLKKMTEQSNAPPIKELRVIAAIDGRDELHVSAAETSWNHVSWVWPPSVRIATLIWDPKKTPVLKNMGTDALLRQRVDFTTAKLTAKRGRGNVELRTFNDKIVLVFDDPPPGADTYDVTITFGN